MTEIDRVLVLGGGVAGLSAAETLADLGWQVTLVERNGHLGGHSESWACMATKTCNRCSACAVSDRIHRVVSHPGIRVRTLARLVDLQGEDGNFQAHLEAVTATDRRICRSHPHFVLGASETLGVAKVVLATGFQTFDPSELPLLNYNRLEGVVTIADLDQYLREDRLPEFFAADEDRIAFIQCVGSRDRERGRDYCSQFCCKASVRLARKLLFERPDLKITIYYIDLQVTGKEFRTFHEQMQSRIRFVQGTPAEILPAEEGDGLRVKVFDPETGEIGYEEHDRVILATGQTPNPINREFAERLHIELAPDGFLALGDPGRSTRSSRPGVYLTGACAGPTDLATACTQALATAAEIGRPSGDYPPNRHLMATGSTRL